MMAIRFSLWILALTNLVQGLIQPIRLRTTNVPEDMGDFETWLDTQGVERSVRIQDDTNVGGGRGLVATRRLESGTVAAWVPVSATIRLEAGGLYDHDDNWAGIMAAKLMREKETGRKSPFFEYLEFGLPKEAPMTPCRWTSRNRLSLQNTTFVEECMRNSVWRRQQAVMYDGDDRRDNKTFMRMIDLVCSRTLRGRDGSRQMVPLIDMANHAPEEAGGGHFSIDETGNVALIVGRRGVDKGQSVTLDYGGRTVEDFLLHYGFVPTRCVSDSLTIDVDGKPLHLSWGDCEGYRGHNDARIREICIEMLRSFPTSLKDDASFVNDMPTGVSDALQAAFSYRIAKKSLLSCLSGVHEY